MLRQRITTLAATLAVLTVACSAPKAPRQGPFVLPAGQQDRYIEFSTSGFGRNGEALMDAAPAAAGEVRGAGIDTALGYGVVVYDTQAAIFNLSSGTATWIPLALQSPVVHVAALEGFATVQSGSEVHVLDLELEQRVTTRDVSDWLRQVGLRKLEAAAPVGEGELCLVASKGGSRGGVTLQKVDISAGEWRMSTRSDVAVFSRVDDVSVDGEGLYLAGIRQKMQRGTGNNAGRMWEDLYVLRAELGDLSHVEIVRRELQERSSRVLQIVAGESLIGTLFANGMVSAYRLNERQTASAPVYEDYVAGATSIAWIGEDQLVVLTNEERRVLDMKDR